MNAGTREPQLAGLELHDAHIKAWEQHTGRRTAAANTDGQSDTEHVPTSMEVLNAMYEKYGPIHPASYDQAAALKRNAKLTPPIPPPPAPSEPPRLIIGGGLELADTMPEADMVMAPCFARGQLATLTAHPGAGKSTVCGSAAVHHALTRALGPLIPESDGWVYYVSREDQAGTALRLQAEAARLQLTEQDRARVNARLRWVLVNENMAPEIIAESMRDDAAGASIDLVFIDTGVALFSGDDENANAQLQAFAARCRWFVDLPGSPCTIIMWHPPKGASAESLTPRGGSSLLGTVDANLTLWRDDDTTTLGYTKLRGPHFEPVKFSLEVVPLVLPSGRSWDIPVARPIGEDKIDARDDATRERRERVLVALATANGERLSLRALAKRVLGSESASSTIRNHLKRLAQAKLVDQDPVSESYRLTPSGKTAVTAIRGKSAAAYRTATDPD